MSSADLPFSPFPKGKMGDVLREDFAVPAEGAAVEKRAEEVEGCHLGERAGEVRGEIKEVGEVVRVKPWTAAEVRARAK